MVIVDEKSMQPPPPYVYVGPVNGPPPFHRHELATFCSLPPHILLQVVYLTFSPGSLADQQLLEKQRKTLYWLAHSLRIVNRALYIACMHVLRSTYLPAYDSLIRSPYSSDPFPMQAPTPLSGGTESLRTIQRETQILDLFIALKVREDVWMDDSELHLEREESFKDLFDLMQPRSRMEDLVRKYGVREGVISIGPISSIGPGNSSPSPTSGVFRFGNTTATSMPSRKAPLRAGPTPLQFSSLTVSFSSRKVGLQLNTSGRKRTIVEVARTRDEKLEAAAKRLVAELKVWLSYNR